MTTPNLDINCFDNHRWKGYWRQYKFNNEMVSQPRSGYYYPCEGDTRSLWPNGWHGCLMSDISWYPHTTISWHDSKHLPQGKLIESSKLIHAVIWEEIISVIFIACSFTHALLLSYFGFFFQLLLCTLHRDCTKFRWQGTHKQPNQYFVYKQMWP